jgi:hypothetical protein
LKLISSKAGVSGYLLSSKNQSVFRLKYAKSEALEIIGRMYYNRDVICLPRKLSKIEKALGIEAKQQKTYLSVR